MISFVVPGPPVGKERPRAGRGGHFYTPQRTHDYEDRVAWAYKAAARGLEKTLGRNLDIRIAIRRDGKRGCDGDNAIKSIMDAIAKARSETDKNYTGGWMFLNEGEPRVEVVIT